MTSVTSRLSRAADEVSSETEGLVLEMRKAFGTMKSLAVDYERDGKSDKVEKLEKMVLEMLDSYEDCVALAQAVKAVPESYQPSDQATNFKGLIETEVSKIKEGSSASGQNHPLFRQFRESIWNVHHAGQPMPGEEQEDVVMTSTQTSIRNVNCPLTGKPVTELPNPVRCKVVCDPLLRIEIEEFRSTEPAVPNATNIEDFTDLNDDDEDDE
ncbi:hypothetical protein EJB05_36505 [Eragrostis curvula]|uniref:SP-RING-type domain-containing protein n=1 Tax=Eragrostis curvula TaxID=38414 RepID=A0A5J9UAT9_9POAL|nr:hypothetical protein EJB05_36505 [Eragrostis curvula]